MNNINVMVRAGQETDIDELCDLFNMANHGDIAEVFQREAKDTETWKDLCARHMLQPMSEIHFSRALVADVGGAVAGALFWLYQEPQPNAEIEQAPLHMKPFLALRNNAPEGLFLRDMAVFPQYRGLGYAARLLDLAIEVAFSFGWRHASAIVHETNVKLLEHYRKRGMVETASHAVLKHSLHAPESRWLLLVLDAPTGSAQALAPAS